MRVCDLTISLRIAGGAMDAATWPALSHLEAAPQPGVEPDLSVLVWEGEGRSPGGPGRHPDPLGGPVVRPIYRTPTMVLCDEAGGGLSAVDFDGSVATHCVADAAGVPVWDRGSPLRLILNWWLQRSGLHMVHAAAVGTPRGVALLGGKGGSGKSTTALACLRAGLEYLGDDYVLLGGASRRHRAFPLYRSAKLEVRHWGDHAWLLPDAALADPADEKVLGFVDRDYLASRAAGLPVRAVVFPRVTDRAHPSLAEMSSGPALLALAPSTLLQLRGGDGSGMEALSGLLRDVPSFSLELGRDVGAVPGLLGRLLDDLRESPDGP